MTLQRKSFNEQSKTASKWMCRSRFLTDMFTCEPALVAGECKETPQYPNCGPCCTRPRGESHQLRFLSAFLGAFDGVGLRGTEVGVATRSLILFAILQQAEPSKGQKDEQRHTS